MEEGGDAEQPTKQDTHSAHMSGEFVKSYVSVTFVLTLGSLVKFGINVGYVILRSYKRW